MLNILTNLDTVSFLNVCLSDECVEISHCGFTLHFHDDTLLTILVFCSVKYLFKPLGHFDCYLNRSSIFSPTSLSVLLSLSSMPESFRILLCEPGYYFWTPHLCKFRFSLPVIYENKQQLSVFHPPKFVVTSLPFSFSCCVYHHLWAFQEERKVNKSIESTIFLYIFWSQILYQIYDLQIFCPTV